MNKLGEDWNTRNGLRNHLIIAFSLGVAVYTIFPKLLILWLVLLCSSLIIYYIAWRLSRRVTVLLKKANIIFVLHNATRSQNISNYLLNFQSYFLQNINQYLPNNVRVEFKPEELKISSHLEAEKLVQNGYAGHTVIIWAEYNEFKKQIRCKNTSFTYEFGYKKIFSDDSLEEFKKRFDQGVQKEINSFFWNLNLSKKRDFDNYVDNIVDLSLYILSRILMSVGEIDKGISTAKEAYQRFFNLNYVEQIKRTNIISAFKDLIFGGYFFKASQEFYSRNKNLRVCAEYLAEALKYKKNDYYGNILMCYLQETYFDNETNALVCLDIARKSKNKMQNSYLINEAYFAIKHKNYSEAAGRYAILKNHGRIDTDVVMLIEDFRQRYEKTSELAFLFAEGFFKHYYLPQENGKAVLEDFYKKTNGVACYEALRKEANLVMLP